MALPPLIAAAARAWQRATLHPMVLAPLIAAAARAANVTFDSGCWAQDCRRCAGWIVRTGERRHGRACNALQGGQFGAAYGLLRLGESLFLDAILKESYGVVPPKCLLVDDSESMLRVLCLFMEHLGFDSLTAHDGDEGISLVRERSPTWSCPTFICRIATGCCCCKTSVR